MNTLAVDPIRWQMRDKNVSQTLGIMVLVTSDTSARFISLTSIYVCCQNPDNQQFEAIDIAFLDRQSLLDWLQSRGGNNPWAENTVLLMLGHDLPESAGGPHQVV